MRTIEYSNQFKRDYKREMKGRHAAYLERELQIVIDILAHGQPFLSRHRDHALAGNWRDCRDCHLRPDLVLIYSFHTPEVVELLRLGSHSELFG